MRNGVVKSEVALVVSAVEAELGMPRHSHARPSRLQWLQSQQQQMQLQRRRSQHQPPHLLSCDPDLDLNPTPPSLKRSLQPPLQSLRHLTSSHCRLQHALRPSSSCSTNPGDDETKKAAVVAAAAAAASDAIDDAVAHAHG